MCRATSSRAAKKWRSTSTNSTVNYWGDCRKAAKPFLTNAVIGGAFVLRACIVNFRTSLADIRALPGIITRLGAELDQSLRPEALRGKQAGAIEIFNLRRSNAMWEYDQPMKLKVGLAEMLKGGVIMDVTTAEQAKIAEDAGACAVMALERVPADIRKEGGVARMASIKIIKEIMARGDDSGDGQGAHRPLCRGAGAGSRGRRLHR